MKRKKRKQTYGDMRGEDRSRARGSWKEKNEKKRSDALFVVASVLVALLLRFWFFLRWHDTPFSGQYFSDSRIYIDLAQQLISSKGLSTAWFMSPMYPLLMSFVMRLTTSFALWLQVVQLLCGSMLVYITWRMSNSVFDRPTAFFAAVLTAGSVPLIFFENMLLPDALLAVFIVAGLYWLLRAVENAGIIYWFLSGAVFGLAVVTRATVVVYLPLLIIVWMFRKEKTKRHFLYITAWAASLLLMVLPSALHNYSAEGVFLPISSSFGYNLYAGNNSEAAGLYKIPEQIDISSDPNGHRFVEDHTGRTMTSVEVSAWWRDKATAWMLGHPVDVLKLFGKKLLLMLSPEEIDQVGLSMNFVEKEYGVIPGIPRQLFSLILILGLAGIALSSLQKKNDWPLRLFFFAYICATAVFFVSGRLRLPLLPLLYIYAGYGSLQLWRLIQSRMFGKQGAVWLFGAALGVVVLILQPEIRQDYAEEYLKLGQISFEREKYEEAVVYSERSLKERPTLHGYLNQANAVAALQQFDKASALYRQALTLDSASYLAWFNYGNMWMQHGDPARAHVCWLRAVQYNPHFAAARRNLGLLLLNAGRLDEAKKQLSLYIDIERDPRLKAEVQRDLDAIKEIQRSGQVP